MHPTDPAAPDNAKLAQRLQDMGRVAGRLAHDFDNILTGVIGFAELTQPLLPPGNAQQHMAELHRVGMQGVELTRRMHQLSRAASVHPRRIEPATLLADLEARCRKTLPANVALEVPASASLPPVLADPDAVRVALEEVLANAVEACAAGGTIEVTAAPVTLGEAECHRLFGAARPGAYVAVTIADNGPGLSLDVVRRLFVEACFTTKPRHRGLGLAIVYRILHAHHAGLLLAPGTHGRTTVRVYLPVAGSNGS